VFILNITLIGNEFMQPMSLEALRPISAEQNFKNLCSSLHDTTSQRFMYCLEGLEPKKAVDAAIQVIHSPYSAKRDVELNAILQRFPNENYGNVCMHLLQANRLQSVVNILNSTPNTRLSDHSSDTFFGKSIKEKYAEGVWLSLHNYKKVSFSTISKIVNLNNDDLIHKIRTKYHSPIFNLDLLESICDSPKVDFMDHIQWCLENISLNRNTYARLNDCLERSVGFEIMERIEVLLPYYRPMYQDGVVLSTASATEKPEIFNMIAELNPNPEKALKAAININDWDDEALDLLKKCVEERGCLKQKDKILKRVEKHNPGPVTTLRRKM